MDAFTTATTAGNIVLTYLEACASYSDEARSLFHRFKWDLRVLKEINTYLEKRQWQTYSDMSTPEDSLIEDTAEYLSDLISKVSASLAKIQASGFWGRTLNQGLWVARRSSLKELEQELNEWTKRFDIRLLGLPPEIKDIIPATPVSPTLSEASTAVVFKSSCRMQQFARLGLKAKKQQVAQLVREPPEALLRELADDNPIHGALLIESQQFILASRPCPPGLGPGADGFQDFVSDLGELAAALHVLDPKAGICLLKVEYFFYEAQRNRFLFVHVPQHPVDEVLTLEAMIERTPYSSMLIKHKTWVPLHERLKLAQKLAEAVFFLNTAGFVHKNIMPTSIITLQRTDVPRAGRFPYTMGDPYIMGFDMVRSKDGVSFFEGTYTRGNTTRQQRDTIARRNVDVFRHPDRLRRDEGSIKRYTKNHDVYSLGVILLQIGLWEPISTVTRRLESDYIGWPERLCEISRDLSVSTGERYRRVVTWCLKVGDDLIKNAEFAQEVLDPLEDMANAVS